MSGNTIGQWARWGYVHSSQSDSEPRVYSAEDAAEAVIVAELLRRGVTHPDVLRAIERLGDSLGRWPLSEARLATVPEGGRARIALHEQGDWVVLGPRGWQGVARPQEARDAPPVDEVRLRLRREPV